MYTLAQKDSVMCIQSSALSRFDFLAHAFCTRHCGVSLGPYAGLNMSPMTGDDPENVSRNWQLLSQAFGIDRDCFFLLSQVHQDGILVLDRSAGQESFRVPPSYDAIITDQPDRALCIRTADCVPVILADPGKRVIANIHAGWKGTALNITGKVIGAMTERFGCRAEQIIGVIGPAIGACCYEVDEPVISAMGQWREGRDVCRPVAALNRWMVDLPRINQNQMASAGIVKENMTLVDLCTSCREDLFFSHRRDKGETGRHVHFIMLKGPRFPDLKKT